MDLIGVDALIKDFEKLETATGLKVMKQAASAAVNPVVRKIKAAAPVGKDLHRTYKGRLVAPGFSKRSLSKKTFSAGGRVTVSIGVKNPEAFYSIQFLDQGNYTVTKRKINGRKKTIKPYQIRGTNFFNRVFESSENKTVDEFSKQLRKKIDKI